MRTIVINWGVIDSLMTGSKSKKVIIVAPKMAGIAKRKENWAASFFGIPRINAVVIVIPDLETPGIIAKACAIPIRIAFFASNGEWILFDKNVKKRKSPVNTKASAKWFWDSKMAIMKDLKYKTNNIDGRVASKRIAKYFWVFLDLGVLMIWIISLL